MDGKQTCLVTGATSGIGKELARHLAAGGHRVILLARPGAKAEAALEELGLACRGGEVSMVPADLAALDDVVAAAARVKQEHGPIQLLVNNAGVFQRKEQRAAGGLEMTLAVNYLAPYLLTRLLLPGGVDRTAGRIVNVGSEVYKAGKLELNDLWAVGKYSGMKAYARSKLALMLFTRSLAERTRAEGLDVICMHPGVIATDVFREYPRWVNKAMGLFISSPGAGAEPLIEMCTSDRARGKTGAYFDKTRERAPKHRDYTEENAELLWGRTEAFLCERLSLTLEPV